MKLAAAALFSLLVAGAPAASRAGPDRLEQAPMPAPRAAHSATLLADGRVLLAGGCRLDGCENGISTDAILFDPATKAFSAAGQLVTARV
ncbi:MAG: kelch repeat-containing protein, partial [Luteimonas sp.]